MVESTGNMALPRANLQLARYYGADARGRKVNPDTFVYQVAVGCFRHVDSMLSLKLEKNFTLVLVQKSLKLDSNLLDELYSIFSFTFFC